MKATGIVRRIDELGRVVIPKEIRRTQRIRQGDALEIFTAPDGEVIFKKYSPLVELREMAGIYTEVLAKSLGTPVLVCDRDVIVAAAGLPKKEWLDTTISTALERLLGGRSLYAATADPAKRLYPREQCDRIVLCAAPIIVQGDVEGGVCLLGGAHAAAPTSEQTRSVGTAAAFLARWMEE
ncbi:MAG: stage V sporulation T C-terminal domain-containing protein [Gemmiger sp.]|nr:stage V sporulation T C-terminal domain-containing protein [Gemmiger sp.]